MCSIIKQAWQRHVKPSLATKIQSRLEEISKQLEDIPRFPTVDQVVAAAASHSVVDRSKGLLEFSDDAELTEVFDEVVETYAIDVKPTKVDAWVEELGDEVNWFGFC